MRLLRNRIYYYLIDDYGNFVGVVYRGKTVNFPWAV